MARDYHDIVSDYAGISSGFSESRKHPVYGTTRKHDGVDIAAPLDTPIQLTTSGVIIRNVTLGSGYGNYVVIRSDLGNGIVVDRLYAHMSSPSEFAVGSILPPGTVVGYVGNTGTSTGPHLHYEERLAILKSIGANGVPIKKW